jgi:DNA-binding response OmpR family regulator
MTTPRKPSILVADDDPQLLTMVAVRLRRRGYKVFEASDGEVALEQVRRRRPDVLILDVMMPNLSGWEVARRVRSDPALSSTAIVVLTAIGERLNDMTAPLYGVDEHLDKPFEFEDLEAAIERVSRRRSAT